MTKISDLSDDLLVKILTFLPTKVAVSSSVLSKQWEFLWMWLPKLEYNDYKVIYSYEDPESVSFLRYREFVAKYLPLHRAPIIESLRLKFCSPLPQPEDINSWVRIAVSRCVRELTICYFEIDEESAVLLPSSLYTCKSLVLLKLKSNMFLVDVPQMGCLPSLKTLLLLHVTYSNEDSLRQLLSYCPVLEDLTIEREYSNDNLRALVIIVPSLLRLSLSTDLDFSSDEYVINTISLKYFEVKDYRETFSYVIERMPELEEAEIFVKQDPKKLLGSISFVKRLSLKVSINWDEEYHAGTVFNQLEHLSLFVSYGRWLKLLVCLLKDSPILRVLNLCIPDFSEFENDQLDCLDGSFVPKCLLDSLETLKFKGYKGRPEEKDFLSYISKHARCLKSSSILP